MGHYLAARNHSSGQDVHDDTFLLSNIGPMVCEFIPQGWMASNSDAPFKSLKEYMVPIEVIEKATGLLFLFCF
jgi:hypothetical protein